MSLEIAVDVGGTFTDLVVHDRDSAVRFYKTPSTPQDIGVGIFSGLDLIAADRGVSRSRLLGECDSFACGTTVATNAILEGKVARTALLCTRGFRDTLLIREGGKADSYNIYMDYPPPYIPRHLTFPIDERVSAEGRIEIPLDIEQARATIQGLSEHGVEAVAVSFLWSIVRPDHELQVAALLEAHLPGVPYSLGHQVNPTLREYRRTSAAAIDASLKPVVRERLAEIEMRLRTEGLDGSITFVTSNGGRTSSAEVLKRPAYLCFSGPSAAPGAACRLARADGDADGNVITVDMGGTSFDVCISTNWETPTHREGAIAGHLFGVPAVEVKTIGAGGGSIARVDAGGFLHVGPRSAGAIPGPVCYGRGGTEPTVTDANLVRGLLDPQRFAGGTIALDYKRAQEAIRLRIAEPLGVGVEEAAYLICVAVEQSMVAAIEDITVRRGIDPREFLLVCGGAAAGLHVAPIAAELGIKKVLVPAAAGVLSAYGIVTGDIKFDFARSYFTRSPDFAFDQVTEVLSDLRGRGLAYLKRMAVPQEAQELVYSAEARYAGQVWQLTLPIPDGRIANSSDLASLVEGFHRLHERAYAVRAPEDPIEFIEWNLQAIGRTEHARSVSSDEPSRREAATEAHRSAYLSVGGGKRDVPVYLGERLRRGDVVNGPALVDVPLTSLFVPEGATALVTSNSGIVLELAR